MINANRSSDELYAIASSNIITQAKYWTTNRGFKKDEKLVNKKFPFVPLVIPQLKK